METSVIRIDNFVYEGRIDGYVKYGAASILTGVPDYKYINPLYVKLNGKPIIFTIMCPVVTGYDSQNKPIVQYRSTEHRLTKLSDIKLEMY